MVSLPDTSLWVGSPSGMRQVSRSTEKRAADNRHVGHSGLNNTAIGWEALYSNTGGNANTALGAVALYYNTNGFANVAVGASALSYATNCSNNIALGFYAGGNIISGNYNIDIGNTGGASDTGIIRIGDQQTQTYIAGVLNGNGGGLTNLNASQLAGGTIPLAQLPGAVLTNGEAGSVTLNGILSLPATTASAGIIYSGGSTLIQSYGNGDFFAGSAAGNLTMSGTDNTGVGYQALHGNTAGFLNTALGYAALSSNTSGFQNAANGASALQSNTIGVANAAVGFQALYCNTNGSFNTAIGPGALYYNINGSNNIALGNSAAYFISGNNNIDIGNKGSSSDNNFIRIGDQQTETFIAGVLNGNGGGLTNLNAASLTGTANNLNLPVTTASTGILYSGGSTLIHDYGNNNFFAGSSAGNLTMTGSGDNTGVGYQALHLNTAGFLNTALGYAALSSNTSGFQNAANGASALQSNTIGVANAAFGFQALYCNTNGSFNTAIGPGALYYNINGSNNIALGNSAAYFISGNNNIDIGNQGSSLDNNFIRIGTQGAQTSACIAGIYGTAAGNGYSTVYVNSSGQLATSTNTMVDSAGANAGALLPGLVFGGPGNGEGIASTRAGAANLNGLDFYTGSTSRLSISNNGNVGIGTNNPTQKLVVAGNIYATGTITPNSDRNLKTGFAAVDPAAVLAQVAKLPIQQWRFKAEPQDVKHLGPMAQDFRSTFGLGEIPTAIATVDADGVALAAIQGLNQKLNEKDAEIQDLKARLERLERLLSRSTGSQ